MRFQENASRNQFESSFPPQTLQPNYKTTTRQSKATSSSNSSNGSLENNQSNLLNNNIISNNNFIRQQKSLFSNLNSKCNGNKTILSINEQIDSNFTIKNKNHQSNKTATINKKIGKNLNHLNLNGTNDCYVTQIKTSTDQKNSALSRLISKMSNHESDEMLENNKINDLDQQQQQPTNLPTLSTQSRVSFF